MKTEVVLAIDIGGTFTKLGLVSREGVALTTRVFKTDAWDLFTTFKKKLAEEVQLLKAQCNQNYNICAIGVGAPNANSYTGNMEHPPNFKWGKEVALVKTLMELFKLPVTIANDANAAAVGELHFGLGKGLQNFVVLTLGTGLGSGIINNGQLLIGAHGMAGEIGHVNVDPGGRMCNCGLRGCLETYASVTGIKRTVFELLSELTDASRLRKLSFEELTGEIIAEEAHKGDAIAMKAFEKTGAILGSKMADTAAHLDPEAFILTGGLSKAGDILLRPVKASMENNLFNAYKGKIKVLLSTAPRDQAVLGPAALAWTNDPNLS